MSLGKGLKVGEVGEWVDSVWHWKLRWRRNGFEWENALREEVLTSLSSVTLNRCGKDTMTWEGEDFSVKKEYDCVSKSNLGS